MKRLFGYFPMGAASDPEVFAVGVAQLFLAHSVSAVEAALSPISGLPAKHKFLPSLAEIAAELDAYTASEQRSAEFLNRFYPSKPVQALPKPCVPRPAIAELRAKYGQNWGLHSEKEKPRGHVSMPLAELKALGGLSDAQWNAIPDAPSGTWKRP